MNKNPIMNLDFPDPDVIRVGDTYYMVSTTMHFMPGGVILKSYDLIHWEIVTHIYETLDSTKERRLEGNHRIYGKGMWAASIRYHNHMFYVCFAANDTKKTYLYTAKRIEGPWEKRDIRGFYHDSSLLFDGDRVYIAYGNSEIHLTELRGDLCGPKEGGLDRVIIRETGSAQLGYEGSHIYKIKGKYYVFCIHSPGGCWYRTQACFMADSLEGAFIGKDVLRDDLGYGGQGVAQGGIVDTPEGDWYAVLFQDRGAVGRIPVVVPVVWNDNFPVFGTNGKVPKTLSIKSTRPNYRYEPLAMSDDFRCMPGIGLKHISLKKVWEFNHEPDRHFWSVTERPGAFRIRTGKISRGLEEAVNTLTQRMTFPGCEIMVTVDVGRMNIGDVAGLAAFQGCFGFIAVRRDEKKTSLVMVGKETDGDMPVVRNGMEREDATKEYERIPVKEEVLTLKMKAEFGLDKDQAEFYYREGKEWKQLGVVQKLYFKLDHFTGCRAGLFLYSTKQVGGIADFMDFRYCILKRESGR